MDAESQDRMQTETEAQSVENRGIDDPIDSPGMPRGLIFGAIVIVAAAIVASTLIGGDEQASSAAEADSESYLDRFATLPVDPPFTTHTGEQIRLGFLEGEPWIAAFVFTRCRGACPIIVSAADRLDSMLLDAEIPTRIIAFTVDPEYDTPDVLAAYVDSAGLGERWTMLHTTDSVVQSLAVDGFSLAIEEGFDPNEPIVHSSRLILVDRSMQIRGYFDVAGPDALARLVAARKELQREEGGDDE